MSNVTGHEGAFPMYNELGHIEWEGLTVREHFASLAMQGLLTKYTLNNPQDQITVTKLSVELADELINQLNK